MSSTKSRKYAPRRPRREQPRSLTAVLLTGLALTAIVLSGFALLAQDDSDPTAEAAGDSVTSTPSSTNNETDSEDVKETADDLEENPGYVQISERFLAVSDDTNRLIRAEGLKCDAARASIEVSSDGGETWNPADISALEPSGVRGLSFRDGGRAQLVYVDGSCVIQHAQSHVYGGAWEESTDPGEDWTLGEETGSNLIVSGTEIKSPCTAADVAGSGEEGIVLCNDATVVTSDDQGETWTDPVLASGARAVTADSGNFDVVFVNSDGCVGITSRVFDGEGLGDRGACSDLEVDGEHIAAATSRGTLFVWADTQILRSDDGGASWY